MEITRREAPYRLLQKGIMIPSKPTDQPQLPRDVTELDDNSLMGLWTEFTAWTDYTAVQVAIAYDDEKRLVKKIERMEARALLMEEKVTVARATVKASQEYEDITQQWLEAEAFRKLLEVMFNNFDRDSQLLSRELTRRTSDVRSRKDRLQT